MKEVGKIKDSCIVIAGQSPKGSSYNDIGEGLEFHQGKKAFGVSVIEHSNVWTTEITKIAEPGDILMSVRAPVGPTNITDRKICIGRGLAAIRCNSDVIPQYILYALRNIESKIIGNDGAVFNSINKKQIEDLPLPIISFSEQQAIVSRLDAAFAKIDALKANAEKQLNDARALFQAELSESMMPKEGWEEKILGEVGTFIRGGNFSKKDFVEKGFPCIHYGQIHTKFGVATYNHLSCVPSSMVKAERCASKGDLVIAITSEDDEGSCKCTAWMADYDAYVGGHTAIFKHILNPLFVSYYFKASRFQKAKLEYTHGFKVVEINPKDIAKISICYPSLPEQQQIVAHLDALSAKVKELEKINEQTQKECDALKQAMLREIFE